MYRKIIHDLKRWKYSPHSPPLILQGAREYENAINWLKTEFKGSLTEQFVCQQLISELEITPYYWSAKEKNSSE